MKTTVVNVRRERCDVYIGRGSKWGNQFVIGRDGDRAEVIRKYRAWLMTQPELLRAIKPELRGRRLGCYCAPLPCHGNVLAELADAPEREDAGPGGQHESAMKARERRGRHASLAPLAGASGAGMR